MYKHTKENEPLQITISEKKRAEIAQDRIGLFFEDINYAADGGLYAEMIENRSFEFYDTYGDKADYYSVYAGQYGWEPYPPMSQATMLCVTGSPVAEENPHYLRFTSQKAGIGFSNKAYDGICLLKGQQYKVSFYARTIAYTGKILIQIQKDHTIFASGEVTPCPGLEKEEKNWVKYELNLVAQKDVRNALFVLILEEAGVVEFDFISMFPQSAVAGIFRKDLFDLLKAIEPGFVRFPGGCVVEGNTLSNRYPFKETLKPVEHRKNNWNRWAVHSNKKENHFHSIFSHYNQTFGIGYYEYFLLCELLHAKALPVLNVGLACQYQSYESVDPASEEFKNYLQDALDLIEFANGDVHSKWGAIRADMGHPAPFGLEMIGIGNEQWETPKSRFFDRYTLFEELIHEKHPQIRLIGSAGPDITSAHYEDAWQFYKQKSQDNTHFVYAVDEHYYVKPEWFYKNTNFYDSYPRDVKVFAGEYAAHPENDGSLPQKNTLGGALAEAAFMTGIERNSDVVVLASYAPLLARIDSSQWAPDLIWFNDEKAYATPSYYVQMLYAKYKGTVTLDTLGTKKTEEKNNIYYNTVLDESSDTIYLKIVNANEQPITLELLLASDKKITITEMVWIGGMQKDLHNSISAPDAISLKKQPLSQDTNIVTLEKNTFAVISIKVSDTK